jgi:hypothetical protein
MPEFSGFSGRDGAPSVASTAGRATVEGRALEAREETREMRFGVTLPRRGAEASPEALVQAAQQAERLGYDGVWRLRAVA